jgi:hypothetical protein
LTLLDVSVPLPLSIPSTTFGEVTFPLNENTEGILLKTFAVQSSDSLQNVNSCHSSKPMSLQGVWRIIAYSEVIEKFNRWNVIELVQSNIPSVIVLKKNENVVEGNDNEVVSWVNVLSWGGSLCPSSFYLFPDRSCVMDNVRYDDL